jgi:hypothetical protein
MRQLPVGIEGIEPHQCVANEQVARRTASLGQSRIASVARKFGGMKNV